MRLSKLSLGMIVLLLITAILGPVALFHSSIRVSTPFQKPLPPNFTLSLHPTNLTIVRGTVDSSNITVTAVNGFLGTVTLAATVRLNSTGILAYLPNSTVTFKSSGPTARIVLLKIYTTTTNNPEIFYNVTVTGTSGTLTHSAVLALILPRADIPPVPSFTFSPTIPTAGTIVTFTSTSYDPDGTIIGWRWSFGDGQIASGPTTTHVYTNNANYTVTLLVVDNGNLTATTSQPITVVLDELPVANFTFAPLTPAVGQSVTFNPVGSFDPDGIIVRYNWTFSDFTTIITFNNASVFHAFANTGSYNLILTVTDSSNFVGFAFATISVGPASDELPVASFIFTPTNATVGQFVLFNGSTSSDPDGAIVFWQWSFGDGQAFQNASAIAFHSYSSPGTYMVSLFVRDNGNQTSSTSALIQIVPKPDIPPIAQFSFSPVNPRVGVTVFFDGSASRDPDGFITSYIWTFGDNASQFGGSFAQHTYFTAGNYTVTLTVMDNAGLTGSASARITVLPRLQHDVAVTGVFTNFNAAIQSQTVGVTVNLANYGTNNETVAVSIFFDSTLVATRTNVPVYLNYFYNQVFIQFDTSSIQPGTYTVSATASLATDQNLSNNSLRDGQITILPGPKLTPTPTSGTLGSKITILGSGFATNQYGYPNQVLVTFDDMFAGFTTTTTGNFSFTLNVPHAEPGIHLIKAQDSAGVHASTSFTVLSEPGSLAVTLTVGAVYFPGDQIAIYALTTINGVPVGPAGVAVSLTGALPNGTTRTLTMSSVGPGLFKASFTAPNQIGTYALVAQAGINSSHASTLASFEVKPSWLSGQGPAVLSIAGIGAVLGLVALVWRNGYFRKDQQP
jgi:YD repeat-containing protein